MLHHGSRLPCAPVTSTSSRLTSTAQRWAAILRSAILRSSPHHSTAPAHTTPPLGESSRRSANPHGCGRLAPPLSETGYTYYGKMRLDAVWRQCKARYNLPWHGTARHGTARRPGTDCRPAAREMRPTPRSGLRRAWLAGAEGRSGTSEAADGREERGSQPRWERCRWRRKRKRWRLKTKMSYGEDDGKSAVKWAKRRSSVVNGTDLKLSLSGLRDKNQWLKPNPRPTGGLFRAPLSFSCDIF